MPDTPDRTLTEILRAYLENNTIRVALYDDSTNFTFDDDTHEFVGDVLDGGTTAQELSGTSGYTGQSDRQTITNQQFSEDNPNDYGIHDGDDITWNNVESAEDIQGWIVYRQEGGDDSTPGDDPIILVVDDDQSDAPSNLPLPTNGSDVTIQWAGDGINRLEGPSP